MLSIAIAVGGHAWGSLWGRKPGEVWESLCLRVRQRFAPTITDPDRRAQLDEIGRITL
jgi:hypothetical protein